MHGEIEHYSTVYDGQRPAESWRIAEDCAGGGKARDGT